MRRADPAFVLRAAGRPDVRARLTLGFYTDATNGVRDMELFIPPGEYATMAPGVPYTLHPVNGKQGYEWTVREGVTVTRK
jgi:hypothetical protein